MREHDGARTIVGDLRFAESPRWRDGELWFTDIDARRVFRVRLGGAPELVVEMEDDRPSGLGWLPDGRLLVVAMTTRQVRRVEPDGRLVLHGDLSDLALGDCNDMVSAPDGTLWLGDMAYDTHGDRSDFKPGHTIRVSPSGEPTTAAAELLAPNGHVLSEDSKTLIVAESGAFRLTAFDVGESGALSGRRIFAELTPEPGVDWAPPDGICLDAEGAAWIADPIGKRFLRVREGGEVTDVVRPRDGACAIACVLGGPDRRTLVMAVSNELPGPNPLPAGNARLDALEVEIPGSGRP